MKDRDTLLIASNNPHKIKKISEIVSGYFDKIILPVDLKRQIFVEENGKSFEENASIKARAYSEIFEDYVIATDGGVMIPVLGEKWNELRTKRFIGEEKKDFERIESLLEMMAPFKGEERRVKWKEAVAIAKKGKILFSKEVSGIEAVIQNGYNKDQYRSGIWVCSVLFFPQFNKNFFELDTNEVAQVEISWAKIKDEIQNFLVKMRKEYGCP